MPYKMITDIADRAEFLALVQLELRNSYGIKYRKEKKQKNGQEKGNVKKIFNIALEQLELTNVILANGTCVQVPVFVADACQRILEQVETEGLFRKAGSAARQREIKASLENGLRLGKTTHHVIDVANILKLFFRELPEPILPPGNIQEIILRSLMNDKDHEHKVKALMTCCLLLPTLCLNTLSFFMQFLNTVSLHSDVNKMTVDNLAIIFAPGLMPLSEMIGQRLNYHVKSIKLLIENSFEIGTIPKSIADKVNNWNVKSTNGDSMISMQMHETDKKKKKRRSGSLTRMFNGLRKIVLGSSESLDVPLDASVLSKEPITTPFLNKSSKRKKILDANGFSAKKKKEVLGFLPENGGVLPNTPIAPKEIKKSRLSLGGKRNSTKTTSQYASSTSIQPMDRRWSVVGASWAKKKHNLYDASTAHQVLPPIKPLSPVVSLPCLQSSNEDDDDNDFIKKIHPLNSSDTDDFVRIPKKEYEAIKERVSAIETRISQEFTNVHASLINHQNDENINQQNNWPIDVLDKYEQTLENTEELTSSASTTDQLAKRLSRELKIRQSFDNKIIRSPSARKIGTIRRRSRENIRLSRNQSWHLGGTCTTTTTRSAAKPCTVTSNINIVLENNLNPLESSICSKTNLKRGRPNTVQTGLRYPSPTKKIPLFINDALAETITSTDIDMKDEKWINAEKFFEPSSFRSPIKLQHKNSIDSSSTTITSVNEMKTPMLPPKLPIRKTPHAIKAPLNYDRMPVIKSVLTPIQDHQTGRASIARLRSQNAGMVAAKAKLFGGMATETEVLRSRQNNGRESIHFSKSSIHDNNKFFVSTNPLVENLKKQHRHRSNTKNSPNHKSSPRREKKMDKCSNNGIQRRQKLRKMKSPAKNSPVKFQNRLNVDALKNKKINGGNQVHSTNQMHALIHETCTPDKRMMKILDDNTPQIKRALIIKSPRRLLKTPTHDNNFHKRKSPLRATPLKLRHSPRLQLHGNQSGY